MLWYHNKKTRVKMALYTTYTPEEAIHLLKFVVLYVVAWIVVVGVGLWRVKGK
jgi:histone acetyltransferase (RNA polymerase elongator complex component)